MRCNEGLVPTERKEKKRQDVHAAELASAFDTRRWTSQVDGRPRIFLLWPVAVAVDVASESSERFDSFDSFVHNG